VAAPHRAVAGAAGARAGHCVPVLAHAASPRRSTSTPKRSRSSPEGSPSDSGATPTRARASRAGPRPSLRPHPGHALPAARTWARWRGGAPAPPWTSGHRPRAAGGERSTCDRASPHRDCARSVTSPTVCCPACSPGARACLVSVKRGFGLPCLEAMSAGVPVVARGQRRLPETCAGGGAGRSGDRTAWPTPSTRRPKPQREPARRGPGAGPLIVLERAARETDALLVGMGGERSTVGMDTHEHAPYSRAPAEYRRGWRLSQVGIPVCLCAVAGTKDRPGGQGRPQGDMNSQAVAEPEAHLRCRSPTRPRAARVTPELTPDGLAATRPRNALRRDSLRRRLLAAADATGLTAPTGSCGSSPRPTSPLWPVSCSSAPSPVGAPDKLLGLYDRDANVMHRLDARRAPPNHPFGRARLGRAVPAGTYRPGNRARPDPDAGLHRRRAARRSRRAHRRARRRQPPFGPRARAHRRSGSVARLLASSSPSTRVPGRAGGVIDEGLGGRPHERRRASLVGHVDDFETTCHTLAIERS